MSNAAVGVSWWDVRNALNEAAKAHSCRIHITMGLPIRLDVGKAWDIRISALRSGKDGVWQEFLGRSAAWPHPDCKTMTGLMFKLVYDLEGALEEQALKEQRCLAAPRLPGF